MVKWPSLTRSRTNSCAIVYTTCLHRKRGKCFLFSFSLTWTCSIHVDLETCSRVLNVLAVLGDVGPLEAVGGVILDGAHGRDVNRRLTLALFCDWETLVPVRGAWRRRGGRVSYSKSHGSKKAIIQIEKLHSKKNSMKIPVTIPRHADSWNIPRPIVFFRYLRPNICVWHRNSFTWKAVHKLRLT